MYEEVKGIFQSFQRNDLDDPFEETLHLMELLNPGLFHGLSVDLIERSGKSIEMIISERKTGVPLEYILSRAVFMGRAFIVTRDTLIPTPETKGLVDAVIESIRKRQKTEPLQTIIDMGTGCGNIAISLALETTGTIIYGSDISPGAVEVSKRNSEIHNVQDHVKVFCGDMFESFKEGGFGGKVDIIVCNPPYMPTESVNKLPPEILDHEPRIAFDAGVFGVDIYIRLLEDALRFLKSRGMLFFEIGEGQERIVQRLIRKNGGYDNIEYIKYEGVVRGLSVRKEDTS